MEEYVRCLMVETGQEWVALQLLAVRNLGKGISPQRERIRKIRQKWRMDRIRLLPGYIFVFSEQEIPLRYYYRFEHLLRVLRYDREPDGYLRGSDLDFALAVRDLDGKLKLLEAVDEEGFIRITDPLLEALHGEVLSVERGKRLAKIRIRLMGQEKILSMNYRLVGTEGQPLTPEEENIEAMVADEGDEWLTSWTPDFAEGVAEMLDATGE